MALQERGFSRTEIAQKLGTNVTLVRRHLKGVPVHGGGIQQKTILDPYKAYLKRHFFEDDFDNIKEIWREIQQQGYSGSYGGVCFLSSSREPFFREKGGHFHSLAKFFCK